MALSIYISFRDFGMVRFIAVSSIIAYGLNTFTLGVQVKKGNTQRVSLRFAWLAIALHTLYIGLLCQQNNGFSFGLSSVASLNILGVIVVLLLSALARPVEKLGLLLFPLAALILGIDVSAHASLHLLPVHTGAMGVHILSSLLAFSLLTLAAMQAILLSIQNAQLKRHPPTRFIGMLPSLQTMETFLFQMMSAGVFVLTIALTTGFLFLHDLFAQHLAHKTILSLLAWAIFCAILLGRWRYGWRGRVAVNWTLAGFCLLLLGYFGSKFVLEMILMRAY